MTNLANDGAASSLLETAWTQREETLYRALFGDLGPGIYPLDLPLFEQMFNCTQVDPRWLHIGVFECPPTPERPHWVYVSSGLSNPWDDEPDAEEEWTGLGRELLLECPQQSPWALALVRRFAAYQMLLAAGRFGDQEPLDAWDRMSVGGPIDGQQSALSAIIMVPSKHYPDEYALVSGKFAFLQIIGLSAAELAHGRAHDFGDLLQTLGDQGAAPLVDAARRSIV